MRDVEGAVPYKGAVPYDFPQDVLMITGTKRNKIRAALVVIKIL